jgi:SdrD B-like domain
MRHHLRFLTLCTIAALTAGCSDTNEPSSVSPQSSQALVGGTAEACAQIGDRVWLDEDCDGIQDKDDTGFTEPGVEGVTVELRTCAGALVSTTTTDATGFYLFDNIEDTVDYRVCFILPSGFNFAPANQGGVEGEDSDAGADGCSSCISVDGCKPIRYVDAGLCEKKEEPCASIGDRVWLDENCDGIQDKDDTGYTEPGVADVTVNLYTCAGAFVATTTTDATGFYLFSDVDDTIDYKVCFELPDGFVFSPKDQGGNDGEDSDVGADGCTDCFEVGDCEDVRDIDAGLCKKEEEGEGCTPGFWKNHYSHWAATPYSPDQVFDSVFDCDLFGDDTTLGEAVHVEWTHNVLAFHAVAALLNASHPGVDFGHDESWVQDQVCDGNKDALADANEQGCPLSGGNTTGDGDKASQQ